MVDEEEVNIKVGCITTDFAMQNVLKQIGLNILANNGRLIKVMQLIVKVHQKSLNLAFKTYIVK